MGSSTQHNALRVLGHVGAVLTNDHFVYTSGKHGSAYVNKDAIYPHTNETSFLCSLFANTSQSVPRAVAPAMSM